MFFIYWSLGELHIKQESNDLSFVLLIFQRLQIAIAVWFLLLFFIGDSTLLHMKRNTVVSWVPWNTLPELSYFTTDDHGWLIILYVLRHDICAYPVKDKDDSMKRHERSIGSIE